MTDAVKSGRLTDAVQNLLDWLAKAEIYLAEDQPILGDLDTVNILIEKHKVSYNKLIDYITLFRPLVNRLLVKLLSNKLTFNLLGAVDLL